MSIEAVVDADGNTLGFSLPVEGCKHESTKPRTADFCPDCGLSDKLRFAVARGERFQALADSIHSDIVSEIDDSARELVASLDFRSIPFGKENAVALTFALRAAAMGLRITVTATDK